MATTGRLPPNAGHGATFVHDAKLSDVTEVKGQIRLRFVNVSGKKITVTRNYQATQRKKGGTPEYKQLESNVQMVGWSRKHTFTYAYACTYAYTYRERWKRTKTKSKSKTNCAQKSRKVKATFEGRARVRASKSFSLHSFTICESACAIPGRHCLLLES